MALMISLISLIFYNLKYSQPYIHSTTSHPIFLFLLLFFVVLCSTVIHRLLSRLCYSYYPFGDGVTMTIVQSLTTDILEVCPRHYVDSDVVNIINKCTLVSYQREGFILCC